MKTITSVMLGLVATLAAYFSALYAYHIYVSSRSIVSPWQAAIPVGLCLVGSAILAGQMNVPPQPVSKAKKALRFTSTTLLITFLAAGVLFVIAFSTLDRP